MQGNRIKIGQIFSAEILADSDVGYDLVKTDPRQSAQIG